LHATCRWSVYHIQSCPSSQKYNPNLVSAEVQSRKSNTRPDFIFGGLTMDTSRKQRYNYVDCSYILDGRRGLRNPKARATSLRRWSEPLTSLAISHLEFLLERIASHLCPLVAPIPSFGVQRSCCIRQKQEARKSIWTLLFYRQIQSLQSCSVSFNWASGWYPCGSNGSFAEHIVRVNGILKNGLC
jgi:hypothetical protein